VRSAVARSPVDDDFSVAASSSFFGYNNILSSAAGFELQRHHILWQVCHSWWWQCFFLVTGSAIWAATVLFG
jgi:hypothetical protein